MDEAPKHNRPGHINMKCNVLVKLNQSKYTGIVRFRIVDRNADTKFRQTVNKMMEQFNSMTFAALLEVRRLHPSMSLNVFKFGSNFKVYKEYPNIAI